MSDTEDAQCEDDLEFLRQAALTSLLKKKSEAVSTNAVFYRPSRNSNLISIQPVVADSIPEDSVNGENCSTDSEDEIIIAEGLSVSSSDCDEIVEEVVMTDDDENNNEDKNQESEGEDAVSVASKDSFDEILNSIEEEINGGTAVKKPSSSTIKKTESKSSRNEQIRQKSVRSPERNKTRSRSSSYQRSSGVRSRRPNYSARNDISRSRSPLRRRSRSRSPNRANHSSYRNEERRPRSPIVRQRRENKPLSNDRRLKSRSPIETRVRSRDRTNRRSDRERSPLNSRQKTQTMKIRSRSSSKNRRADRSAKSSPLRNEKDNRDTRRTREKEKSPSPSESWQNLTPEERERLEKRRRKFQSSNVKPSSGKIMLKQANEVSSKSEVRHEPITFTRTMEDDFPDNDGGRDRNRRDADKERRERKLKLSSRLGIKVTEEEASTRPSTLSEEEESSNLSPSHEVTGRLVESLESFETSSALAEQQHAASLDKDDLRSKLEQKRASGGGRLFTFALRDTFEDPSKDKRSRRKVVSMK